MQSYKINLKNKRKFLALGAESAGNFSAYANGEIFSSEDFGDLLGEKNFEKYKHQLDKFLKKGFEPDFILCDFHPLLETTLLAQQLAKKFKAEMIPIQHHLSHIYSAVGDRMIQNPKYKIGNSFYGIACDGTGLGTDEKIWGGEIFKITKKSKAELQRIAHLENQILLGGELAIKEPARMLIAILGKFLEKQEVFALVKKYYSKNEFELLWNQYQQKFNCIETSSTGRVLDAVSILLEFVGNKRGYKHEAIDLLEKNSSDPYSDIKPKIVKLENSNLTLDTTHLFQYLIRNLSKDKKRLAATAQAYIAQGLCSLIDEHRLSSSEEIFFAGGMANNKIMSAILESKGAYTNKKIPRGDAGLSFGQITYGLLADSRD